MNWQEHYTDKHCCNKYNYRPPSKLERHQFRSSFYQIMRPHLTGEYKLEFVPLTEKQIAEQESLPQHWRLPLSYGFSPSGVRMPSERSKSAFDWPMSRPIQKYTQPMKGYYKYTLIKQPSESNVRGGKLFWLMVIGAAVWFWFVR
ncbi:MAG: hypothetical protein JGK24_32000 [Microcoleus sp. PH2017_29_MFU_D_A]|uniref:hypothetical protein n=1 Tax=unclassified Microcoleus TaxID=2642155 RepID=UPI001D5DDB9E|nr:MULTISPECIES: hypothetical protein [unclassified Microcoleus]MCC3418943.1 hypothetical protein [Microcoleus sp. PH2017_07_MST_O_A]MCC3509750.1 hypothetical protein [Microcoleus sp. PH2017_17_BER_D_A]MCC3427230.1 hypothetical protein [Microcoleus sp. PH2017_01_SCD_O_A]MCC3455890.1 hypothetical protein [Microcoleus sp. PH2017_08_TRC_O_A]MCC3474135.1 hypothetical protein [Microcoleus sp. PH2017_13_LAR_U_A]